MGKSKKTKASRKTTEKILSKVLKDIEKQNFETEEEENKYLQNILGKDMNEIFSDNIQITKSEQAQELIWDAWDLEDSEDRIELAIEALKLDKNCAGAYNLLAEDKSETTEEAMEYFFKAIEAGKKNLGKDFDKFKGQFWGFHETRPFMRAMAGLASEYSYNNQIQDAVNIWKEMLELNPNDNQGVRYELLSSLLVMKKYKEAEKLINLYKDDPSAEWLYSKAYLYFSLKSKKTMAIKALVKAMKMNPYVPLYLFGLKEMPDEMPEYISIGDEREAISYVNSAFSLWVKNKKALVWVADIHKKNLNEFESIIRKNEEKENKRNNYN